MGRPCSSKEGDGRWRETGVGSDQHDSERKASYRSKAEEGRLLKEVEGASESEAVGGIMQAADSGPCGHNVIHGYLRRRSAK